MTQQTDAQAVLAYLRTAADPLTDAAQLFVDPDNDLDTLDLEDLETIGQAILTSLLSLNMALEGLVKITASRQAPIDGQEKGD